MSLLARSVVPVNILCLCVRVHEGLIQSFKVQQYNVSSTYHFFAPFAMMKYTSNTDLYLTYMWITLVSFLSFLAVAVFPLRVEIRS